MHKPIIYGLGLAFFSLLNPISAQKKQDNAPITYSKLTEEQIQELVESNPEKLMQLVRDKKLSANQLKSFVIYLGLVGGDPRGFREELTRLYWSQISPANRLDPEHVRALNDLNSPYDDNWQKLQSPYLLYTLANQAAYEKAWGKPAVHQFQVDALSLRIDEPHKLSLQQRETIAAKHYVQVSKIAPLHAKTVEAKGNYEYVYRHCTDPAEEAKWGKIYFENYCCDPAEIYASSKKLIGQRVDKDEAQMWINAIDRMLKFDYKDFLNMPKTWLLTQIGQVSEAKKLLDWCENEMWGDEFEREYVLPELAKAMQQFR